jgi:hypothetical protein
VDDLKITTKITINRRSNVATLMDVDPSPIEKLKFGKDFQNGMKVVEEIVR